MPLGRYMGYQQAGRHLERIPSGRQVSRFRWAYRHLERMPFRQAGKLDTNRQIDIWRGYL